MLSRWLRRWFGKKTNPTVTRSRKGQRRPTTRLFLEMLEDRIAPAVVSDPVLQLSDINQTTQASTPSNFVGSVNGKTFFEANDGINGIQLWMTNGTPGNATMLTNPGNTLHTGTVPLIVQHRRDRTLRDRHAVEQEPRAVILRRAILACMIVRRGDGRLLGAADPRADGAAVAA